MKQIQVQTNQTLSMTNLAKPSL